MRLLYAAWLALLGMLFAVLALCWAVVMPVLMMLTWAVRQFTETVQWAKGR